MSIEYGGWWEQWIERGTVNPDDYDGIEVHPCAKVGCGPDDCCVETCERDEAQFWSAYVHLKAGGVECIGDFATEQEAWDYAKGVAAGYDWRYV